MSHQNPPDAARVSRIFFYILMFAILGWFTYMQFFGADERRLNVNSDSMIYTGTFTWEKSDGTSEEITVPGRYDLPVGETMVLTTRLPEDYHENTMAIRSSLQDVKFYIMAHCALLTTPARHDWPAKTLPAVIFSVRLRRPMPAKNSASS